ncbi:hypothetical protein XI08_12555 [Bradyrhizobium sp. CCBAU 11361]|nr:hypothetical protein [Bradyrhizobium sp. CCBAU 11361]
MSVLDPVRKLCPACGRPMKFVRGEACRSLERYVCSNCDPLHDPTALKWVDGPLKPPSTA